MRFEEHLVFHGLAVKKLATAEEVAAAVQLEPAFVRDVLSSASNRVAEVKGKFTLLPATRVIIKGEYSRHYRELRANADFVSAYEAFEKINDDLKALITKWQVHDVGGAQVANDHSDKDYDEKIIDQLGTLHDRFEPVLRTMVNALPRLSVYEVGLDLALERAETGKIEWVSDVKIPSYHTLWFELHEDLLCKLGRTRSE